MNSQKLITVKSSVELVEKLNSCVAGKKADIKDIRSGQYIVLHQGILKRRSDPGIKCFRCLEESHILLHMEKGDGHFDIPDNLPKHLQVCQSECKRIPSTISFETDVSLFILNLLDGCVLPNNGGRGPIVLQSLTPVIYLTGKHPRFAGAKVTLLTDSDSFWKDIHTQELPVQKIELLAEMTDLRIGILSWVLYFRYSIPKSITNVIPPNIYLKAELGSTDQFVDPIIFASEKDKQTGEITTYLVKSAATSLVMDLPKELI